MQFCDSTCQWCARHFFRWFKDRMKTSERKAGRSGEGDFGAAAATSNRPDGQRRHDGFVRYGS
jgi:hypothetical protein